ncbi:MAG TPA: hypothetical protein VLM91_19530 [Candidatus Methylomirabilis sp.]|nr:hypothetical protein [Candidatus Methylomirabilis sp.]
MNRQVLDRRQFLERFMQSLVGLGVGAAVLNLLGGGSPRRVDAADLPPGATYQATGFYERTAIGRETLVALVLVPLNGTAPPVIQDGPDLERRDLGSATLETFRRQVDGMQQRILFDHGALRAVVYSARTIDGEYAQEKRYLIGRSELDIENPRARVQKIEGGGGHGGGGSGSGGGSSGGGM